MKTKNYTISNEQIPVTEMAAEKLDNYRFDIKNHFSAQGSEDVIIDMDFALLDKLNAIVEGKTNKTIEINDVENIIQQLGTIEQLTESTTENNIIVTAKKLYRTKTNSWLGGVCSGLAVYMGMPIWLLRLVFIIAVFTPLPIIILYLLLWYILPLAQNKSDELQMHGIPVNLSSLTNTKGYTYNKVFNLAKIALIIFVLIALLFVSIISMRLILG